MTTSSMGPLFPLHVMDEPSPAVPQSVTVFLICLIPGVFYHCSCEQGILDSLSAYMTRQLSCEHKLGCTTEGFQATRVLICFFGLDPTDPEQDVRFVLDML